MKKNIIKSLTFLAVLSASFNVSAYYRTWGQERSFFQNKKSGYVSLKGFYSFAQVGSVENNLDVLPVMYCVSGATGELTDCVYDGDTSGSPDWTEDGGYSLITEFENYQPNTTSFDDNTFGISVAAGLYFNINDMPMRVEFEYSSRKSITHNDNRIYDTQKPINGASAAAVYTDVSVNSEIDNISYMINLYYDFEDFNKDIYGNSSNIVPYVGVSAGISRNEVVMTLVDEYNEWLYSTVGADMVTQSEADLDKDCDGDGTKDDKTFCYAYYKPYKTTNYTFSWGVSGGMKYKISDIYSFDFGARYLNLGTVEWKHDVTADDEEKDSLSKKSFLISDSFSVIEITAGFRVSF